MSSRLLDNLNDEVKESIGNATDDLNFQAEGKVDQAKRTLQQVDEEKETISNKLNEFSLNNNRQ